MARETGNPRRWAKPVPIENIGEVERRRPQRRYSRQLIDETIAVWQPYYETMLTDEDACEIIENMTSFVGTLFGLRPRIPGRAEADPNSN